MPEVVAVVVASAALLAFRHYAARQITARRGRFMWAFAFPMILFGPVAIWTGLRLLSSGVIFGGLLVVVGAAGAAAELLFFWRAPRAVSAPALDQDLWDALDRPTTDFVLVMAVGGLLFGIVGGMALVVWAVLSRQ